MPDAWLRELAPKDQNAHATLAAMQLAPLPSASNQLQVRPDSLGLCPQTNQDAQVASLVVRGWGMAGNKHQTVDWLCDAAVRVLGLGVCPTPAVRALQATSVV